MTGAPTSMPRGVPAQHDFHRLTIPQTLAVEEVDEQRGLSTAEAQGRRATHGANTFTAGAPEPRWRAFVRQYADVMQLVLLVAALGSLYPLRQWGTCLVLLGLTLFNAVLGLRQEGKAAAAVAALQKMMIVKAKVRRDGHVTELPAEELVPGDVVVIEAGDLVPADGRLVRAAALEVAESALTGESVPVAKGVETVAQLDAPLGDRTDMVYMNTNVTRGSGALVVTATGMSTEIGRVSGMLQAQEDVQTPLTRQLGALTNQILVVAGVALLVSVILNLARGNEFDVVFTAAIAFAISAVPTGLPAVVTAILSLGTRMLAEANAIVKRLRSAETLGSTSAINSDKTGTLTLNQMTAVELTIPGRRYTISGTGYSTEGVIKHAFGQRDVPLEQFLLPMALASDATVPDGHLVGDPTEGALVVLAEKGGLDAEETRRQFPRIAELPFDAAYKLMATFHRMTDEQGAEVVRCLVKGAPDQLLARAEQTLDPDDLRVVPVDQGFRQRYLEENRRLGERGLRVMSTGRKDFDPRAFDPSAALLPQLDGLTVLALVGIEDPPRPAARAAIATAKAAGIQVRMITGDHEVTAHAIARRLGIDGRAISGTEFGNLADDEAMAAIDGVGVIARVTPEHKVRLVDILQRKGHVVAMTGDGVNDAPALKKADIGIAMGITGTEVSKEAAAMILTDDNFATIVHAVQLGRALYDNLRTYVYFQMGALLGFVTTFLGASILDIAAGVPFLPLQTLWVNFTTQVFQAIGLGYGKPAPGLMQRGPRGPQDKILPARKLAWSAFVGLVLGAGTLGVIAWAAHTYDDTALARTMGLTTFSLFNLFLALTVRDELRSVFSLDTLDDHRLVLMSGLSVAAIVLATELDLFEKILTTRSLSLPQWLICILVSLSIVVVSEIRKAIHRRQARRDRSLPAFVPAAAVTPQDPVDDEEHR